MRRRLRAFFEPLQERADEMLSVLQTGRGTRQNPRDRAHVHVIIKRAARHHHDGSFKRKNIPISVESYLFLLLSPIWYHPYPFQDYYSRARILFCLTRVAMYVCSLAVNNNYNDIQYRTIPLSECWSTSAIEIGPQVLYIGAGQISGAKSIPHTRFYNNNNNIIVFRFSGQIYDYTVVCTRARTFPSCILHRLNVLGWIIWHFLPISVSSWFFFHTLFDCTLFRADTHDIILYK